MTRSNTFSARAGRRTRIILQLVAVIAIALPTIDGPIGVDPALADPATGPTAVVQNTAGAIPAGTVPDGTCAAKVTANGGGGASLPAQAGAGGIGGAGARIAATFAVVPGQSYGGTVGAGGTVPNGGAGSANGGNAGSTGNTHPGGGGGGATRVTFAGATAVIAGGGGGGGGAHSNSPSGNGGGAGFTGIAAGTAAAGSTGTVGVDTPDTVGAGQGGQAAAGGTGGVNSGSAARNGSAGLGVGTGTGGAGGNDTNADTGGGGGGGYTGGGGGALTTDQGDPVTGAGGGGGSSFVAATAPVSGAPAPTAISGVAGTASPNSSNPGATGSVTIDWIPCLYDLGLTKTVSSASVNAGGKVTWTVSVTNNGPNVMTRGDTVILTDSLPAGPNGAPAPANKVTSFTVTPGSSSGGLSSGALTCSGVTVGSAMPASTTCTRADGAPSAGGPPPATGTRGLDVGETITITYEQIISNAAPCATITNTATVKDRPTQSGTTDIVGDTVTDTVNRNLTINCYDLAITKTVGSPTVNRNGTITWTISVTNSGPGAMAGPDDTTANPLVITDNFPSGGGISTPTTGAQTGPAGPCTRSGNTITCTNGLAAGATQTLVFTQTAGNATAYGTVISNTATVSDPKGGDSNDSSTATTTVRPPPTVNLAKSVTSRANAADQFTVSILNGATNVASASTSGSGTTASTGATNLTQGTTYTLSEAMAGGSVSTLSQYNKSIACSNSTGGSATVLPSGSGSSFSITPANNDVITCTFTNAPAPSTITFNKSISSRFAAADQFTAQIKNGVTVTGSGTTAGAGTTASTGSVAVTPGTTYTLTEIMAAGPSALSDYSSSISCTNATGGSPTTLPSGAGQSFTITPAAADAITCTLTNAAKPHVTLVKSVASRVVAGDQFTVAITHGAGPITDASASTTGVGTSATTGIQGLVAGTTYTLTDAMAGGSPSALSDYLSSIACTNANGSSSTTLPSGSGTSFTLTPAAADNITCTFTNTAKPHVTLVKSVASGANAADQFTVQLNNGASTVASATTAGAGTSATTGSQTLTGGTTYTLTEVMAGGSASVLGQYASSIACTNTNGSSPTTLPSGNGTSFSLTPANGDNITCTITNTAGTASLALTKNATPATNVTVGAVITYTYGVTNSGSLPLTNVTVSDPHTGLSTITCTPAQGSTLAAGATMSCSATYTVTQADVDAGSIINTGTVTAKDPSNTTVQQTAGKTVTATQTASLSLSKTALPNSGVVAGDIVTYTFSGQNTGTVTLHNVTVTDPMPGLSAVNCTPTTPATLAPNATISCTATYTVTQANVDAGSFSNTATIAGLDPLNNPVSGADTETVNTLRIGTATLTKDATPDTGLVADDVVTYSLHGENTGTVTLHNVTVTDPMSGLSAIACTPAAPATLAPGDDIDCTATYTVTQADVDNGSIANTATLSGLEPTNAVVQANGSKTVLADQSPSVSMTKSATPDTGVVEGDVVTYTFDVENTGTVTLHGVDVSDPMPGLSAVACTPAAPATLAPGDDLSCTATYTVTQADVDNGSIANTATVDALDPNDDPVTNTASTTVTADQSPELSATKSATPDSGVVAGDVVTYTVTGTNTGTVTLSGVDVTDPMPDLGAFDCTPTAPASLAPGDDISCTADYTVTQADVDAGSIANTATVAGSFDGDPVDDTAGTTVTADQNASLSIDKSAAPAANVDLGDTITYTFDVENTGTVTVDDVDVTDPMPGLSAITCTPTTPATLAPGDDISCTATYTVTQADVDAGQIDNTATVSGDDPNGDPVTNTDSASVTTHQAPAVTVDKTATPDSGVVEGDVVTYTFTGENTGNVTLDTVDVTDPMPGLSAITCTPTAPATLAPGDDISCTATYTVTQADVDAGQIDNTATISGDDPNGDPVTNTGSTTVTADQTPEFTLNKTASPDSGVNVGDQITYAFTGQNTGTVTLDNVDIADPMTGLSAIACTPTTPATLAPDDVVNCSATYTVTQADVDAGSFTNTATINGDDPNGDPVTDTAGATVTTVGGADITFTKTASPDADVHVGDEITYTFAALNSGGVTLHDVTVTDPMSGLSPLDCTPAAPATLAVDDEMNCTATYTVTQADVDNGEIVNTATVDALDPNDDQVTNDDSTTVLADQVESVSLTKTASPNGKVAVGDVITYTMVATNNGTVTLDNVVVSDPMPGLSALDCTPAAGATLAPGASMTCTAEYTVTDADIIRGTIDNTATVSGDSLQGHGTSNASTAIVPTSTESDAELTKTLADLSGNTATWDLTVTSTGVGAFPGPFTVTDELPEGLTYVSAEGDGWTCTGTSTVRCTHAGDLAEGDATTVKLVTTVSGTGTITNVASMDVLGETVRSDASVAPAQEGSGFAFTGGEAQRYGLMGLLLVLGGWMVLLAARKRDEDQIIES